MDGERALSRGGGQVVDCWMYHRLSGRGGGQDLVYTQSVSVGHLKGDTAGGLGTWWSLGCICLCVCVVDIFCGTRI